MYGKSKWLYMLVGLLVVLSMVLTSCAPAPEPAPEEPGAEPAVETEEPEEAMDEAVEAEFLPADGMVECLPFPELAFAGSGHVQTRPASPVVETAISAPADVEVQQAAGSVYRVGVFEDMTSANFWAANGPDNTVWNSYMDPGRPVMFDQTMKYFTIVPSVAADFNEPLTQEGDFWVVEVPMREDIVWSDGTPLTAADVAFTANTILDMGLISGNFQTWADPNFLDSVEAVGDYTVKYVYHTKPGLARHEMGVLQSPILSEAFWGPHVEAAMEVINALGDSPSEEDLLAAQAEAQDLLFNVDPTGEPYGAQFMQVKWEKGAFVELEANPDYYWSGTEVTQWGNGAYSDSNGHEAGTPAGDPEVTYVVGPYAESVVYSYYGSQDAAILALKNGEVDFVINPLGLQRGLADQIRSDASLTVLENGVNGFRYLSFNNRRRPMNDCSFRQAVAVLIDKEFVTQTILQGQAFPLYSFVPEANKTWYSDEAPKIGEGLSREERTNLAVAILEQAGYTWEGDQKPYWDPDNRQVVAAGHLIMPDGTPGPELHMYAPSPGYDPLRSTFAIWIETWMNEFGIPFTAHLAGFNVIVPIIFTEQAFDMYILGWSLDIFPSFLRDFFSEEQAVLDGNNAGGYVNAEFEELSSELLVCETVDECKAIADQIQIMLATEMPYVLLFDTGIIEAYRSEGVEYPFTDTLSGLQYIHQIGGGGSGVQSQVNIK
jgi:ABC-type transport system substrate-binding protein